ncbi:hypothetical protein GPAL_3109 [Glaciecola pallidula DSM 14239 = ACAM 615]|uniref:Uncharacterized protein n=1 Tax=Brumicola pallidula DSM 14239 = ACAM 615 TaxID=1121922 RepID=K7A388_9ALTE|nr:hypothetical protein GPAL_3109 [Glaciecola pallidula DSM 14239 = ACAM 615]
MQQSAHGNMGTFFFNIIVNVSEVINLKKALIKSTYKKHL